MPGRPRVADVEERGATGAHPGAEGGIRVPEPDAAATPSILVPAIKPDPGADPETLANAEGGLDRDAIKRLAEKPATSPVSALPPEQRKVRVVGPAFLPDPAGAIDLQAPARKTAQ